MRFVGAQLSKSTLILGFGAVSPFWPPGLEVQTRRRHAMKLVVHSSLLAAQPQKPLGGRTCGYPAVWVWKAGLPGMDRRISQSKGRGEGWSLEGKEQRIWVWTGIVWTPLGLPPSFPLPG